MATRDQIADRILDLKRSTTDLLESLAEADAEREQRAEQRRLERIATASEATAANTQPQVYRDELSVAERSKLVGDLGQEKYLALPYRRP